MELLLLIIILIIIGIWSGALALQGAAAVLKNGVTDRRRAAHELERRQVATEEAEGRLDRLGKRLQDPTLTPQAFLSDVAAAIADFVQLQANVTADYLTKKKHPARRAAEEVRDVSVRLRAATREYKFARYKVALYEREAPWLRDLLDAEYPAIEEALDAVSDEDITRRYLSAAEYSQLSSAQRNQLALDRYWRAGKSSWQLGRDYERYIGYLWETKGFAVEYHGIEEGLQDLGRDLIARRGSEFVVIQCKHWATFRTVRERHVYQLFGTSLDLALSLRAADLAQPELTLFPELLSTMRIQPVLVTSATLSPKAKAVAAALGVAVEESRSRQQYPSIKCNVSRTTGERIYHLPFDQQYDAVRIEPKRGELYVTTAAEAEHLGFRRAFKWHGEQTSTGQTA